MSREKRPLDSARDGLPSEKRPRPALASVIVEALKMESLQKLCSTLEPLLRRVVGEEVEKALAKLAPAAAKGGLTYKASPKRIQGVESTLRLQFRNKLALPLFTGSKVEGEQGSAIHVVLQDSTTGQVVTTGPESSAKLDIVVLEGDFSVDDEEDWTEEEFENFVVKEREGKRPLLTGDLSVTLKEGVGSLGELSFTDNSSWIRSRKFRLGVKLSAGYCEGLRIREGKTDAFSVKDHRGELYKKHYPPALTDEVWRLDKIGKDGAFHKRLNKAGIYSVEDFLRLVVMDPQKLRNILGSGMSNRMWEGTVEHAKTCVLSGKLYVYYADEKQNIGVIFNNIFQLMGLMAGGQYLSVDSLSDSEKVYVDKLVKVAYENWESVVEYDGEALIGSVPQSLRGIDTQTEEPANGSRMNNSQTNSQQQQLQQQQQQQQQQQHQHQQGSYAANEDYGLFRPQRQQQNGVSSSVGRYEQMSSGYPQRDESSLLPSSSVPSFVSNTSSGGYMQQSNATNSSNSSAALISASSDWMLNSNSSNSNKQQQQQQQAEEYSEEEIRAKSLELLESDDMNAQMQQLIRLFNAGAAGGGGGMGDAGGGAAGGGALMMMPSYDTFFSSLASSNPASPLSGERRSKVSWLKLKAALRWGIFVRKRAAAKRAQIEELEEDE